MAGAQQRPPRPRVGGRPLALDLASLHPRWADRLVEATRQPIRAADAVCGMGRVHNDRLLLDGRRPVHGRPAVRPGAGGDLPPRLPRVSDRPSAAPARASDRRGRLRGVDRISNSRAVARRLRPGQPARADEPAGHRPDAAANRARGARRAARRRRCAPPRFAGGERQAVAAADRAAGRLVRAGAGGARRDALRRPLRVAVVREDPRGRLRRARPCPGGVPDRAALGAARPLGRRRSLRRARCEPGAGGPPRRARQGAPRPIAGPRLLAARSERMGQCRRPPGRGPQPRSGASDDPDQTATASAWLR